ncbi:carbamoyltransferase HypF [[Phormidium ambiguum] IAM M-71]|uniref:Carbamoyltransferase n=1 Tax=[Phormidium ambiguum] IAM M-71 TaxID=454136 RepID=A0A1U7IAP6_9CYAN|nr:carbamoyltransferase HypF [Phormidium ambiguum]OKH33578.1 carbamoyltransferase HypF [Phormidium ambiguum IAM M-71]
MTNNKYRLRITIRGAVQGVGFRPFIYRLATELQLLGWVNNSAQGVFIEVESSREKLESFLLRIEGEKPARSHIQSLESSWLDLVNYSNFEIRPSVSGEKTAVILPDIATCPDCLSDIFDSENRRYLYPFTNCTNCGPRYSIIQGLPYDRINTTMQNFVMCEQCKSEYENPLDRRFHAQPNACPKCGPKLELWDKEGNILANNHNALLAAANAIKEGKVVAVKGLGGFHLMVDAANSAMVQELRRRKKRSGKPFAMMYPSVDLVKEDCEVSELEERFLCSAESPIVLLKRGCFLNRRDAEGAERNKREFSVIAPGNPYVGVMLPYTPLHHLLMGELGFPVVATSGNVSNEPICIDEKDALVKLGDIADLFLVHNRPIVRSIDDSIVRVILGREMVMRRARGYAPLPIPSPQSPVPSPLLAVGAHLKNSIAISLNNQVFLSQHIGDLETVAAFDSFKNTIESLANIYDFKPQIIACDAHPDYLSTQYAKQLDLPVIPVQHHYAHVLACMAENELESPVLGVAWDGTGYGLDGTIWGGEFLYITQDSFQRIAHFRTFKLPGGDKAVKEPRRVAIGLLYEIFGDRLFTMSELAPVQAFSAKELPILQTMLNKNLHSPLTSSAGRLFDAIASLINLRQIDSFEGQAAMELEFALDAIATEESYQLTIQNDRLDWQSMVLEIINDINQKVPIPIISAKFHNALATAIVTVAKQNGIAQIVLTGGCFQNKYLTEKTVQYLQENSFSPYWHQRIPTNDGGIALGQIMAGLRRI